ncbi:DUF4286 family protein [Aquicella lusitana]|uniref:Uncharacterized protein DUF4286 n=1 Tax=Aquicella lusitana TaxID=254246 RepID=A0A370GH75_9COXI|nr:DUF4286 family protein [Aquicella lusitana]RDI42596.1 uncharacterized protein DUF4286 [Aquicella lusitana]VVC74374.1 hypothetical protein AQULUS_21400 [Aquicella lusitana]
MVIYEVNLNVSHEIYDDYYKWLLEHIKAMLKLDGFKKAEIGLIKGEEDDGKKHIRVNYLVDSYNHLKQYLTHDAPAMRVEGLQKFGDKFSASRRIIVSPIVLESAVS